MTASAPRRALIGSSADREHALLRALLIVQDLQAKVPGAIDVLRSVGEEAEAQGWDEVARAALFGEAVRAWVRRDSDGFSVAIARLRARAEADGSAASLATALAMSAAEWSFEPEEGSTSLADAHLARATVLLESAGGHPLERVSAHNACAIAYDQRNLWELEDAQYAAAEALMLEAGPNPLTAAVLFNRIDVSTGWACALREVGELELALDRCDVAEAALLSSADVAMPDRWRQELAALGLLVAALRGDADAASRAREAFGQLSGATQYRGHLHLAIALSEHRVELAAAAAAEQALACFDPSVDSVGHDLAMRVAAEIESRQLPTRSAGLRYAERQVRIRWQTRLSALASMRARLEVERLRTEHDQLTRHAHLDDLTGLSNRRGQRRYVNQLLADGVEQMSMLLVDLDDFKRVNDVFGHAVGDLALARLADILASNVRPADLAARLGGDEFLLLLSGVDAVSAHRRAESIVAAVADTAWHQVSPSLRLTVSVGLATGHPADLDVLGERADVAMYRAKAAGGSQVVSAEHMV